MTTRLTKSAAPEDPIITQPAPTQPMGGRKKVLSTASAAIKPAVPETPGPASTPIPTADAIKAAAARSADIDRRISVAAEVMLKEIPVDLVKNSTADLSSIPMWLTAYCLGTGKFSKAAYMINELRQGHKFTREVEAGDTDGIMQTFKDGVNLMQAMNKLASAAHDSISKQCNKLGVTPAVLAVKLAKEIIGEDDVDAPGASRRFGVLKSASFAPMTKNAAATALSINRITDQRVSTDFHRFVKSAYPSVRFLDQMATWELEQQITKIAEDTKEIEVKKESDECDEGECSVENMSVDKITDGVKAIGELMKGADPEAEFKIKIIISKFPKLRKAQNIEAFDKAGSAAMFAGDTYSLALSVIGLAAEGVYGQAAKQEAIK